MDTKLLNLVRPDTLLNRTALLSPVGVRIKQVSLYIFHTMKFYTKIVNYSENIKFL